jgi:protein TonB
MSDFWQEDIEQRSRGRKTRVWIVRSILGLVLVCFVGVVAWGALSLFSEKKGHKKQIVQVSILKLPPPPPPPPPPEQKIPEPEVKREIKQPDPEPKQAEEAPPPGEQLGLDAEGSGTGDGFGLAARKGGQDITTLGGGGQSNRAQHQWFAGQVQSFLQEQFQRNDKLRTADYRLVVKVWFNADGTISRYEFIDSSGNPEIDRNLKLAMDGAGRIRHSPPPDLPQPVRLRITSRGAG